MKLLFLIIFSACQSAPEVNPEASQGKIYFPFVDNTPLGTNAPPKKFVMKSIQGNTEYVIEIPDAGEDYNIEIPMLALDGGNRPFRKEDFDAAVRTDKEMTASLPQVSDGNPETAQLVDKAFGVGKSGGPEQAPSYVLTLSRITSLYKERQYEFCLIEINNLLEFYPNSAKLYKMKGSVYLKMQNFGLAEKAWQQALNITPNDRSLRQGMVNLQKKISLNQAK